MGSVGMSKVVTEICGATGQGSDDTVQERRLQLSGFAGPALRPHWERWRPRRKQEEAATLRRLQTAGAASCAHRTVCEIQVQKESQPRTQLLI